jgi:putative intracellular protease/amidase
MSRKILCILSEWGFWGEELVGPLDAFDKQGYEVVFATSTGRCPVPLPPSEDPTFVDPPLGRPVTSEDNARKTREVSESGRLEKPVSLSA